MNSPRRSANELFAATRDFTVENSTQNALAIASTLAALATTLGLAAFAPLWPVRLVAGVVAGLVVVRTFCLYHDVMHGAILRKSPIGRALFSIFGILVQTPPTIWKETHNYHHAHTAKLVGSNIGSYPMATPAMFAAFSPFQRWLYRAARHPLTIGFGVFTVFFLGMGVRPTLRSPLKYWDSAASVIATVGIPVTLTLLGYGDVAFFAHFLPLAVASAAGGYLFYAQHNFPGIKVAPRESWNFVDASLDSSSFMKMGPVMNWFTANIGYHHVHHLNAAIPFYRLPEAMAAVPELQHPTETSWWPKDVMACFRLKLWDSERNEMVGYP